MIEKIKNQIKLLKSIRRISKIGNSKVIFYRKLKISISFLISFSIYLTLTLTSIEGLIDLSIMQNILLAFLIIIPLTFFILISPNIFNYIYKFIEVHKYSESTKQELPQLSYKLFLTITKLKKYRKYIEGLNQKNYNFMKKSYIYKLSNKEIEEKAIDSVIEDEMDTEDLLINLNKYMEEVKESNLKIESKNITYYCIISKILNNLDYILYNEHKYIIIENIEKYFNQYTQQNLFERLEKSQKKFDEYYIKSNITKYKKYLLQEEPKNIDTKNKILKSI